MRVSVSESYRFARTARAMGDGSELSLQAAAELQHPAYHALRAALGWHAGTFNPVTFAALLREEGARIADGDTWREYMRANRSGSSFRLDRRTRAAIFVAVKANRTIAAHA